MMVIRLLFIVIIFLFLNPIIDGQTIYGVSSYWNDSFKEWILLAPDEKNDGMFFKEAALGIDFIHGDLKALDSLFTVWRTGAGKTESDPEMIRFCCKGTAEA